MPEKYLPIDDDVGIKIFPSRHSIARDDERYFHYSGKQPEFADSLKSTEQTQQLEQQMENDPSVLRNYAVRQGKSFNSLIISSSAPQHPHHTGDFDNGNPSSPPFEAGASKNSPTTVDSNVKLRSPRPSTNQSNASAARPSQPYRTAQISAGLMNAQQNHPGSTKQSRSLPPQDPAFYAAAAAEGVTRRAYEDHYLAEHGVQRSPTRPQPEPRQLYTEDYSQGPSPLQSESTPRRRSRFSLSPGNAPADEASVFTYQDYHRLHHYRARAAADERNNGQDEQDFEVDEKVVRRTYAEQRKSALLENIPVLGKRNPELVAELKKLDKGIHSLTLKREEDRRELLRRHEQANQLIEQLRKQYTADKFIEVIPTVTQDGDVIPEWKRQTLAKKLAADELRRQEQLIMEEVERGAIEGFQRSS